jgi:hypothetical protein
MALDRKARLKAMLAKTGGFDASGIAEALGDDVARIEAVIQSLTAYRDDLVDDGMKNLRWTMSGWPSLDRIDAGRRIDTAVSWEFRDRFRPRTFRLRYDLESAEFSAECEARLDGGGWVAVPVTDAQLDDLVAMVPLEQRNRAIDLHEEFRRVTSGMPAPAMR